MIDPVISNEFVYDEAPFPSCHAATIAETRSGLVCSFFGGTHERHPDVCIYVCRQVDGRWSAPQRVADGVQADGTRLPTWNPVLFQPKQGPLMLFYKVGPTPRDWWGMIRTSMDQGQTWSEAKKLPDGILGPIKNKPVEGPDGTIICPSSAEDPPAGWRVHFEISHDHGATWQRTPAVEHDPLIRAIQPSLLMHPGGKLQAIGRTRDTGLFETWSTDHGQTWSRLGLLDLPNPNSGTDAVTLADGRHLLIYNHSATMKVRWPLNLAISSDGRQWEAACVIETEPPGQYSYPSIIQSSDGRAHVVYTWKRLRIRHAVIDVTKLEGRPIKRGIWPVEKWPLPTSPND